MNFIGTANMLLLTLPSARFHAHSNKCNIARIANMNSLQMAINISMPNYSTNVIILHHIDYYVVFSMRF